MKKYITFFCMAIFMLLLNACGNGDTKEGGNRKKIVIIDCNNSNSQFGIDDCGDSLIPNYYTCLNSGDSIVNEVNNTNVSIIHDINDNKKVCTLTGSAYILR